MEVLTNFTVIIIFKKDFIYLFLEWETQREREGKKYQYVVASHAPPTGDLVHNPGMCPRLGIKPATLWFTGWRLVHGATPARAGNHSETYKCIKPFHCKFTISHHKFT